MELALRGLLGEQRQVVEKHASFVHETDVLAEGVTISEPGRLVIGKWNVDIEGKTATTKITKRLGVPGQFESAVIEVEFQLGVIRSL